jgi:Polysaccharide biosynthesis protein.
MAVCQTIPSIFIVILYLAIQENLYYTVVNKGLDISLIISTGLIFEITLSVVFMLLLILLKPVLTPLIIFHVPFFPFIYYTLFSSIIMIFSSTYLLLLQANEGSVMYSVVSFLFFLFSTLFTVYLLMMRNLGALSSIIANLVANCILAVIAIIYLFTKFGFQFSYKKLRRMLLFSLPLIPHSLSYWIKESIDRLMLAGLSSLQNTGIYQIAISYGGILNFGTQAFYNANTPRFFSLIKDKNANEDKIIGMMPISVACFSVLGFGLSLFSPEIISLLTIKNYHGAAQYVPFVSSAAVLFMIYNNVVNVLYYGSKTMLIAIVSIAASIISSIISFVLVKNYGIWGAAISLVCSNLILSLSFYFSAQYFLRIPWPIKKCLFLSFLPILAFAGIKLVSELSSLQQLFTKLFFLIVYALSCYLIIKSDLKYIET